MMQRFVRSLRNRFTAPVVIACACILGVSGLTPSCKDTITDAPPNIVFPDSGISYGKYIEPLFTQACALAACHAGASPAASLDLTFPSYSNLMNHQPQLVVQHDGLHSLLVERLDGRIQPLMPLNRQQLTQNQITGIKRWIDEGGMNN